jgi:class 3 adenylate cyclase/tetratricopeptide (TPR) repeat protein
LAGAFNSPSAFRGVPPNRRLAALMLTDMVGYTWVAQRSEADALRLLEEHRVLVRGALRDHHGREVKTLGDGFLVEFGSAIDAVECAREIQRRFYERNLTPGVERIELRIALHVGDVVVEGTDVLGDAVNIVARLEPLSDPGGILVSGPFLDQVRGKIDLPFEAIPTPPLKHVLRPVPVYRAELPWLVPPVPPLTPWADREKELERLTGILEGVRRGQGRAAILRGEAGVGKTRLAEELLRIAEPTGFRVLRVRVHRGEADVPYGPWAEAVRSFARDASDSSLVTACAQHPEEIIRLVPELEERLGSHPVEIAGSTAEARNRLCEAIVRFFLAAAREQPLILYLDGFQWADPYSCQLLQRAVAQLPAARWLLLVTYREGDPSETPQAGQLWGELRAEPGLLTEPLRKFGVAELDQLLDAMLPQPKLPEEVRRVLYARSDGNALFAEELVRQLVDAGSLVRSKRGWELKSREQLRVPETIRGVLQERLSRLNPATLQLLRAASVAGGRCSYTVLQKISELPDDLLLVTLERALQARVVEERSSPSGEVEILFRDPQTCQLLYEGLSLVRARNYHRKLAEVLEQLPAAARVGSVGSLADHFYRGNVPAKALQYSIAAARRSAELYAHEDAARRYQLALDLAAEVGSAPSDRAEILGALAKELELLGRTTEAVKSYEEVSALWERAGEVRRASAIHSWIAILLNDLVGQQDRVLSHSERAVALLETTGESAELAQALYSLASNTSRWGNDPARARELFRRCVDLAARLGDLRTEAFGGYFLAISQPISQKQESLRLARGIVAKLVEADHATAPGILFNVGSMLYLGGLGDSATARALLEKAGEISRRKGIRRYDSAIALGVAELLRLSGDWDAAESRAREVREREPEENVLDHVEAWILLIRLAIDRGQLEDASQSLSRLQGSRYNDILLTPEARLTLAVLRAELSLEADDLAGARAALAPAFDDPASAEPVIASARVWTQARYIDTVLAARTGDRSTARSGLARLTEVARQIDEPWARGWAGRAEGLLALSSGDPTSAIAPLEASLGEWERMGWPFEVGRGLFVLGRALRESGDLARAGDLLDRAGQMFTRLGAERYLRRVQDAMGASPEAGPPVSR